MSNDSNNIVYVPGKIKEICICNDFTSGAIYVNVDVYSHSALIMPRIAVVSYEPPEVRK